LGMSSSLTNSLHDFSEGSTTVFSRPETLRCWRCTGELNDRQRSYQPPMGQWGTIINSSATQIERTSVSGRFAKYAWGRQFVSQLAGFWDGASANSPFFRPHK
jgi:hypothetical protein